MISILQADGVAEQQQLAAMRARAKRNNEAVERTVAAVKRVHPYEEPVINVIPLCRTSF